MDKRVRLAVLAAFAAATLLAACSPTLNIKEVSWNGEPEHSARKEPAQETSEPDEALAEAGYVNIGTLSVLNVEGRSYSRTSSERLRFEAAAHGGDRVRFSSRDRFSADERSVTRCVRTSVYGSGAYRRTECVEEEQEQVKVGMVESVASVWRYMPEVAQSRLYAKRFCTALKGGDVSVVKELARKGVDVNLRYCQVTTMGVYGPSTSPGHFPLAMAGERGDGAMFTALLELGASIKTAGNVSELARSGDPQVVSAMLEHGVAPESVLFGAIFSRRMEAVRAVMARKPRLDSKHLKAALATGNGEIVALVTAQVDPATIADKHSLLVAAAEGSAEMLRLVEKWGGRLDTDPPLARELIMAATKARRADSIDYLAKAGAKDGATEAMWLVVNSKDPQPGDAAVVEALVKAGGDPNSKDGGGYMPLHRLAKSKRPEHVGVARALLEHGADPNADSREGPPLKIAIDYHKAETRRKFGRTTEYLPTAALLVEHGADPNLEVDGHTLLQHAVLGGDYALPMVKLLLEHGADPALPGACRERTAHQPAGGPHTCNALDLTYNRTLRKPIWSREETAAYLRSLGVKPAAMGQ